LNQNAQTSECILEPIPNEFSIKRDTDKNAIYEFTMDRLYICFKSKKTKTYGVMWTNCETRKWTQIQFRTLNPIMELNFIISEGLLLIHTVDNKIKTSSDNHQVHRTFYRIPLKTPVKSEDLAWFSLIRLQKHLRNGDPYGEARKYLRPTSCIQCPF